MTTNIYVLADTSYKMQRHSARLTEILNKYARALAFSNGKAKLHIIGYNDKAKIIEPFKRIQTNGNPNLGEGLKLLESVVKYQRKYDGKQARSVFILHIGENTLDIISTIISIFSSISEGEVTALGVISTIVEIIVLVAAVLLFFCAKDAR